MTPKIITSYVFPPIPTRNFDWCAYYEGEEGDECGYGPTKHIAIMDLIENYPREDSE